MRKWMSNPVLGVLAGALVLLMSGCPASKKPSKLETSLANVAKDVVIPFEAQNLKNPASATDENIQAGQQTCNNAPCVTLPTDARRRSSASQCIRRPWI